MVWPYESESGWLSDLEIWPAFLACVGSVGILVFRWAEKDPVAVGSHLPKTEMMLFLGISSERKATWMSVLLAITSSMKFLSESSSLPPTAKSLRRTGSRSSTLVLVCLNTSRKYLGLGKDAICANAPAERSNPVTKVRNSIVLLVTNGLDGIQFGGLYGRINTEQKSDEHGDSERDDDRRSGDDGGPARGGGDNLRQRESEPDTDQAAGDGNEHGLREELTHNIGLACTDGPADADFARALEDRGEHDVHDADAADQQGNAGDADHDDAEDGLGLFFLFEQAGRHGDREIAGVFMGGRQDGGDHVGGFDGIDVGLNLHVNPVDFILQIAGLILEAAHHGVERRDNHVVAVEGLDAFHFSIAAGLGFEDADDL